MTYGIKLTEKNEKERWDHDFYNPRYPDPLNAIETEEKDLIDMEVDPDIYWF